MNYQLLEKELKKRLDSPYVWGRKQADDFDKRLEILEGVTFLMTKRYGTICPTQASSL